MQDDVCFFSQAVELWQEADILSKLHHLNVVAFYGVVQDGPGGSMATVTEYMVDGSLRRVLLRKDRNNGNYSLDGHGSTNESDMKRMRRPYHAKTFEVEISSNANHFQCFTWARIREFPKSHKSV